MSDYRLSVLQSGVQQPLSTPFGIASITPPPTNPQMIMQRADEVNMILRMLTDMQTSAVMLLGSPGAGKSTLAALLYHHLQLAKQANMPGPHHLVWLGIGPYTTLPDIIAAILDAIDKKEPGFFLQKPEQQIASLRRALRHSQETALIVLDQFEWLLLPGTEQELAARGALVPFLEMLQTDLGSSRILLTGYESPYAEDLEETRVRTYLVSRISIPEGVTLLQQRGVQGTHEELSLVWQRCSGLVFALVLFSAFIRSSGISLNYLLNARDYQPFWAGDVVSHLIAGIYYYLTPVQYALMRALSLFSEPVPLPAILFTITGNNTLAAHPQSLAYTTFERELAALAGFSLVQVSLDKNGTTCYSLHLLLSTYIQEHYLENNENRQGVSLMALGIRLPANQQQDRAQDAQMAVAAGNTQVAAYYLQVAHQHYPPKERRKTLHDLEPLLMALRHLCLARRCQQASDLLFQEGLHECMVQWGAWNPLVALYTFLLSSPGSLRRRTEGLIYGQLGMLYGRMGNERQGDAYFQQALAIQRETGDRYGEATTLANYGELLRAREQPEQARASFEYALSLSQQNGDVYTQCSLLHNLGLLFHSAKDYTKALGLYQESLRLACSLNNQQHQGLILTNMGMVLYEQGMPTEGLSLLLAALKLRLSLQDSTAIQLELFLQALEQKMGTESFSQFCQRALSMQQQVLARFVPMDMRQ